MMLYSTRGEADIRRAASGGSSRPAELRRIITLMFSTGRGRAKKRTIKLFEFVGFLL